MNDLITILIILAALISFLNKIFGQKKRAGTGQQRPESEPSLPPWFPPWLEAEPEEAKRPTTERKKPEPPRSRKIEKVPTGPQPERAVPTRQSQAYAAPSPAIEIPKSDNQLLRSIKQAMESSSELRRGILLAEILGPCRAKRRTHRII